MHHTHNYLLAFTRLQEALAITHPSQFEKDSIIQRFEFCVELAWKSMKEILEIGGTIITAPNEVIRTAAQQNLITDPTTWLEALKARNIASHPYNQQFADELVTTIQMRFITILTSYAEFAQQYESNHS